MLFQVLLWECECIEVVVLDGIGDLAGAADASSKDLLYVVLERAEIRQKLELSKTS